MNEASMKKKVIIFGTDGLLGSTLATIGREQPGIEIVALNHQQMDITDQIAVEICMKNNRPSVVINCASLINIEACEKNPLSAWQVNTLGPGNIAQAMEKAGLKESTLIQISSSDVFGEDKQSFEEIDQPNPVNVYGWSKWAGEKLIEQISKNCGLNYYIVRSSWLYGKGRQTFVDFVVETLKRGELMNVVTDQYNVPTSASDLALAIIKLIESPTPYPFGIYHLTNDYTIRPSKYDIAVFIAGYLSLENKALLKPSFRQDVFTVNRPGSAMLVNRSTIRLPDWKESLIAYLGGRYDKKSDIAK